MTMQQAEQAMLTPAFQRHFAQHRTVFYPMRIIRRGIKRLMRSNQLDFMRRRRGQNLIDQLDLRQRNMPAGMVTPPDTVLTNQKKMLGFQHGFHLAKKQLITRKWINKTGP